MGFICLCLKIVSNTCFFRLIKYSHEKRVQLLHYCNKWVKRNGFFIFFLKNLALSTRRIYNYYYYYYSCWVQRTLYIYNYTNIIYCIIDACARPQLRRHATMIFKRTPIVLAEHIDLRCNSICIRTPENSVRFYRVIKIYCTRVHTHSRPVAVIHFPCFIILIVLLLGNNYTVSDF